MNEVSFFVPGIPRPGGSKRVFGIKKGGVYTGRFVVTDDAGKGNKDWRASVAHSGSGAMIGGSPWIGPLELLLEFRLLRPKFHLRSDGVTVRDSAPPFPIVMPDVGKLARSTTDALTSIVWVDDAQIVREVHAKLYSTTPGCFVTVRKMFDDLL